jgi:hypothetical protein
MSQKFDFLEEARYLNDEEIKLVALYMFTFRKLNNRRNLAKKVHFRNLVTNSLHNR